MSSYDAWITHDTAREAAEEHAENGHTYDWHGVCRYCGELDPYYPDNPYDERRGN